MDSNVMNEKESLVHGKKVAESSPCRFMSPPKTCILTEPPDAFSTNRNSLTTVGTSYFKGKVDEFCGDTSFTKKSYNEGIGNGLAVAERRTPILREPESCIETGKHHPDEKILKEELWRKFEAATTSRIIFNSSHLESTGSNKGSPDLLEEVSCSIGTGKHHPGENMLKDELWRKFEATTTHRWINFSGSDPENTASNKGFLGLLEGVSC